MQCGSGRKIRIRKRAHSRTILDLTTHSAIDDMALLLRQQALRGALPRELLAACTLSLNSRHFSVLSRPPPNYPGHVPLTRIEKAGLAVGSAVMSLSDPHRGGIALSN
jgi:hypothetical protein